MVQPEVIGRTQVVGWMRDAIAQALELPPASLTSGTMAPAGLAVSVHVDDPALAHTYFSRLCSAALDGPPRDRIYVLTGKAAGLGPVPQWDAKDCGPARFQELVESAGIRAAYPVRPRVWQFSDARLRVGIQLSASRGHLPRWDGAAPLRRHLHWLLEAQGLRLTHAASLGWNGRGVLLLGRGGTGKSGTTLAGLAAGLTTVGDDYVALDAAEAPFARPLFRILKQDKEGLRRIPGLLARIADLDGNWQGKIEFDAGELFPGAIVEQLAIDAILLPQLAHATIPTILPARPGEAMLALMSSNLHQYLGEKEAGMALFADLLRRLPCYRMALSDDPGRNGEVLRGFLETLPLQMPPAAATAAAGAGQDRRQ